jgi:Protein of unknown function (DUF2794)
MMTPGSAALFQLRDFRRRYKTTYFDRAELSQLLDLYSRKVAAGEWRDYAIDHRDGVALFSVFRHTHESPTFTIVKRVEASRNAREFAVFQGRHRLHAGASLAEALAVLKKRLALVRTS